MVLFSPYYLLLLLLLPIYILWQRQLRRRQQRKLAILYHISIRQQWGAVDKNGWGHWLQQALLMVVFIALVIALSRPYHGKEQKKATLSQHKVVFLIDISRSMYAGDIQPSRLQRAKNIAIATIEDLKHSAIAVVSFSGKPFINALFSEDKVSLIQIIKRLKPYYFYQRGSNLAAAIATTVELFQDAKQPLHIIVISDGENHQKIPPITAQQNIYITCVGVGTLVGGIIPDKTSIDGKFKDEYGNTVYSKLERDSLQQIATAYRGHYLSGKSTNIEKALVKWVQSSPQLEQKKSEVVLLREYYQIFLLVALFALLGWVICYFSLAKYNKDKNL